MSDSDTKKCPACAEEIKSEAIKCRFCGEEFKSREDIFLGKIKDIILESNTKWSIRDQGVNTMHFLYTKKEEKADCGSACCLGCLFLPVGIIYAILGGNKGFEKSVTIKLDGDAIIVLGDPYYMLMVYDLLKKKGVKLKETKEIKKAKGWRLFLKK